MDSRSASLVVVLAALAAQGAGGRVWLLVDQSGSVDAGVQAQLRKALTNPCVFHLAEQSLGADAGDRRFRLTQFTAEVRDSGWETADAVCGSLGALLARRRGGDQTTPVLRAVEEALAERAPEDALHVVLATDGLPDSEAGRWTRDGEPNQMACGDVLRDAGFSAKKVRAWCAPSAGRNSIGSAAVELAKLGQLVRDAGVGLLEGEAQCPSVTLTLVAAATDSTASEVMRRVLERPLGSAIRVAHADGGAQLAAHVRDQTAAAGLDWFVDERNGRWCARSRCRGSQTGPSGSVHPSKAAALDAARVSCGGKRCDANGDCYSLAPPPDAGPPPVTASADAGRGDGCRQEAAWTRRVVALGDDLRFHCSGTLLDSQTVLTARHCLPITRVRLGEVVRAPEAEHAVRAFAVPSQALDLALLRLDRPVPDQSPVALADAVQGFRPLLHVGYGALDRAGRVGFGVRHLVAFPPSEVECAGRRAARLGCVPGAELVLPASDGRDTCAGDSGGGLFSVALGASAGVCEPTLVAVTSRAVGAAATSCGGGGIYTRVDVARGWIDAVVRDWNRRR